MEKIKDYMFLKKLRNVFTMCLQKEGAYAYITSFIVLFLLFFTYLYTTTPYYNSVKVIVSQETANNKLYFDMGYSYKEHFTVPIKKNIAIIGNRYANIQLIQSIAIKDKKGNFIELPFNADHYKSYSHIYIYHQIILSLIIAFILLYTCSQLKNVSGFVRIHKNSILFFLLIFSFYAILVQILHPVVSNDSYSQFVSISVANYNGFTLTYSTLATSGYILFGSPQILILIISLFSISFFLFYVCLIAKKIHIVFAICFAILIPAFPFIISEIAITERPVVGLWAVTGLVMAIYNATSKQSNKKLFYLSCFFLFLASMIRYDLCFYFTGALLLYFMPSKGFLKTVILALLIPASVVILSMVSEKIISGNVVQFNAQSVAQGKMGVFGYLVRDNLLSKEDMHRLSKYLDIEKIQQKWREGPWFENYGVALPTYRDDYYPALIKDIVSKYRKKYPLEYMQSRLRFTYQLLEVIKRPSVRIKRNYGLLNHIKQNKIAGGQQGKAMRFVQLFHSDLQSKLAGIFHKYNYPLLFAGLLYFAAIVFCFINRQYFSRLGSVAIIAIFIGPLIKYISLVRAAAMASSLYTLDISLIFFIVIPLCIPFFVNSLKRRSSGA